LLAFTHRARLLATHEAAGIVSAFADALALLRVWANQRGYGSTAEGDNSRVMVGFENRGAWWVSVLELLVYGEQPAASGVVKVRRKGLGKGLSSYQMFRGALDFLGEISVILPERGN
jgi:U3 small nucleolar RNA-associated protein 22